ncbi:hypothetical protein Pryu01_01723 [Paraliobacillus ryukyuensis]|uniref:Uncharacterized protein n=1 Tax=Paraliobacillus ryukyuensis TaxID=200904 RepID=A0A366E778_9BACI|nr:hypothetical protein [Paraliobacillus ryukyuensis]RBO98240.1 hypothetical protein DES48_10590 [Paraliobacillus ryukyuensis]
MVTHEQLVMEKEKVRELEKYKKALNKVEAEYDQLVLQENRYRKKLEEEKVDVEKLEGVSLTSLFVTLVGKKDDRLLKEKEEVLAAQLRFEEAKAAKQEVYQELMTLKKQISDIADAPSRYQKMLNEKQEVLIHKQETPQLLQLNETIADLQADQKEIEEAYEAGLNAKLALKRALNYLEKAGNWGTVDLFGGGLISTSIKHGHMDDARNEVRYAQQLLRKFARELDDIGTKFSADVSISGGLTFMDYFFDGVIADWMVQDKIHRSQEQVNQMYQQTSHTLAKLDELRKDTKATLVKSKQHWEQVILSK